MGPVLGLMERTIDSYVPVPDAMPTPRQLVPDALAPAVSAA